MLEKLLASLDTLFKDSDHTKLLHIHGHLKIKDKYLESLKTLLKQMEELGVPQEVRDACATKLFEELIVKFYLSSLSVLHQHKNDYVTTEYLKIWAHWIKEKELGLDIPLPGAASLTEKIQYEAYKNIELVIEWKYEFISSSSKQKHTVKTNDPSLYAATLENAKKIIDYDKAFQQMQTWVTEMNEEWFKLEKVEEPAQKDQELTTPPLEEKHIDSPGEVAFKCVKAFIAQFKKGVVEKFNKQLNVENESLKEEDENLKEEDKNLKKEREKLKKENKHYAILAKDPFFKALLNLKPEEFNFTFLF